jgi:hypothetical protein
MLRFTHIQCWSSFCFGRSENSQPEIPRRRRIGWFDGGFESESTIRSNRDWAGLTRFDGSSETSRTRNLNASGMNGGQ